jgi:hypothetical protein
LVFRGELDAIARAHPAFDVQYTVTRPAGSAEPWKGRVGRVDASWIRETAEPLARPKYYVTGLPEMVEEIVNLLRGPLAVSEDDIDYEIFRGF